MSDHVRLPAVLEHVRRLLRPAAGPDSSDAALLGRFIATREEAAFTALVRRYGPLVLDVCRRVLGDAHDAEDAFQATFLVLARQAASVRRRASVGSWLYGVAYRVASRARLDAARRRAHENRVPLMTPPTSADDTWQELRPLLDEALHRLPGKYRLPLVLCYLEGKTNEEAARELGCPPGSMSWRLSRGRELLRAHLTRRGVVLPAVALAAALTGAKASAAPSAPLMNATVQAVLGYSAGTLVASGPIAALADGVVRGLSMARLRVVLLVALAIGAVGLGAGLVAANRFTDQPADTAAPDAPEAGAIVVPASGRRDMLGDPLPNGALARLGTTRLRHRGFTPIAFAPDGRLVSGGVNGFRVWDKATGRLVRRFGEFGFDPEPMVYCSALGFTPDGRTAVVLDSSRRELGVWDVATGKVRRRHDLDEDSIAHHLLVSPDGNHLAAFDRDRLVHFDLASGEKTALFFWGNGVRSVTFSPDGKRLAVACGDAKVRVFPVPPRGDRPDETLNVPGFGKVNEPGRRAVLFAPDGKTLATVCGRNLQLWEGKPLQAVRTLEVSDACAAFSPDGKTLAVGDAEGTVRFWDRATGKVALQWQAPPGEFRWIGFAPDGRTLGTAGRTEQAVRLWDVATGKIRHKFAAHWPEWSDAVSLTFSPDGELLALRDAVQIRLWEVASGRQRSAEGRADGTVSPDLTTLLIRNDAGWPCLVDLITGKELVRLPEDVGTGSSLAFSRDGRLLAVGDTAEAIRLLDTATGREVRRFPGDADGNTVLGFAPDGKILVTEAVRREPHRSFLHVWGVADGKRLREFALTDLCNIPSVLAFTADGRPLIAGEARADVQCWDVMTGKVHFTFPRVRADIQGGNRFVAFSADGTLTALGSSIGIATGDGVDNPRSYEHTAIRIWDLPTGQPLRQVPKDLMQVQAGAFAPDGRLLALGGEDGMVRLVELATGKVVRELRGHDCEVTSLLFAHDGRRLLSRSQDTTALLWDLGGLPGGRELSAGELAGLWADLAEDDAARAYRAGCSLAARPSQAVSFLRGQLRAVSTVDPEQAARLIAELGSESFADRQRATATLEELDRAAEPALRKALDAQPTLEVRQRLEQLLGRLEGLTPTRLRAVRAAAVLEQIGDAEARRLLRALAEGVPAARLTQEAKASLRRLEAHRP